MRYLISALIVLSLVIVGLYAWVDRYSGIDAIKPLAVNAFDKAVIDKGASLVAIGDCAVCHTKPGGESLAGGREIRTPFGTIFSTNITPDIDSGIGV